MLSDLQKTRIEGAFHSIQQSPGYHQLRQFIQGELAEDVPDLGALHAHFVSVFSDRVLKDITQISEATAKRREL